MLFVAGVPVLEGVPAREGVPALEQADAAIAMTMHKDTAACPRYRTGAITTAR
jgi:hypothetical protein